MSRESSKKHIRHPLRKRILAFFLKALLVLLLLEFLFYFGSNLFLSRYAQRKINEATHDVYVVDFNRFNFSLLRRGFFLDGLVLQPVNSDLRNEDQVLFDIKLDQVGFSRLWYDFFEREFTIGKIYLDNPNIQMSLGSDSAADITKSTKNKDVSQVKLLEQEIRKSIQQMNLGAFRIGEIEIKHANVLFFNFLSKSNLNAEKTSLLVKNIDLTTKGEWTTPFNAEGFEFELEGVDFALPDEVHTLQAKKVFISSLDNLINISAFSIRPDLTKSGKSYYTVDLEKLLLGNVDLNKAFMTSELEVDELILNEPFFKVANNPDSQSDSLATGNLNEFIQGILKSVDIKELSINEGKFVKSQIGDTLKNRIELDRFNFKMIKFYLGEDSLRQENQFFYGEDASMDIEGGSLYLGDEIHLIKGEKIFVSSFKDELTIRNLSVFPREEAIKSKSPENLIRISLPEFSLEDIDLKKLYNEGVFNVSNLLIDRPNVEIVDLEYSEKKSEEVSTNELISGFLSQATIRSLEVREGTVQFTDARGNRSNDVGFDRFSFFLDDLTIQADPSLPIQDQFYAEEIALELYNYRLKIKDNLHVIRADKLMVDSRRSLLEVQNLSIKPESKEQIQTLLDTYGKTSAVDFTVPLFRAQGLDVKAALTEQKLKVSLIDMPNPEFLIDTYKSKVKDKNEESLQSTADVKSLLLDYFTSISIDSLDLREAKIKYQSLVENKRSKFEENNFSLKLKNFFLNPTDSSFSGQTLFSEEIDLTFNNYSFSIAGGKYLAETDLLNYNSKEKIIRLGGLILQPGEETDSRLNLGLNFPQVILKGVDIEEFIFDNVLDLQMLEIDRGLVEIGIDQKVSLGPNSGRQRNVQNALQLLKIDSIQAKNSELQVSYLGENDSRQSIKTGFDFLIKDFFMDTLLVDRSDLSSLFSTLNLDLKDFVFALPDSVHTISFSNVGLGDQREEVLFSNLRITPKDHFGKSGSPVIDAKIDQLSIRNNGLTDILDSKVVDLSAITLINPQVDLYLDTQKSAGPGKEKTIAESKMVESILLGDLRLKNGRVQVHRKGLGPDPRLNFPEFNFLVEDLGIDLMNQEQKLDLKELVTKNISFEIKGYQVDTPDSNYRVSFESIGYTDGDLELQGIYFRPILGNYALLRSLSYQTDAVTAKVNSIRLEDLDPAEYMQNQKLKANNLIVSGADLDLFRDKRIPGDINLYKPMPQYLMSHARVSADIFSVRVRDSRVRYYEFAPKGNMPGMVSFDRVQMDLAPFYLRKEGEVYPLDKARIGIQAHIMDQSEVDLSAELYFGEDYPMEVKVKMNDFSFSEADDFLSKTLFVKAIDGTVTDGEWNFRLNDDFAKGRMNFGYTSLKIQFLDSLTLERGLGKLKIYTFGANLLAKNNNPRGGKGKIVSRRIFLERDKSKFVFSAWWKATFSGLRGTFGLGRAKIPKDLRKEEEE
ncbi:hypothetical protein [Algoriphagus confluentis]|uniref:Translocation/assembly module TamB n=1 Tax=Algoriphagus confluentis TaxID=1697556 RepID=A0ABQ6PWP4_9BACT|nr:hypothetical protein Aconfl_38050 [Algoriphagus confluentis]